MLEEELGNLLERSQVSSQTILKLISQKLVLLISVFRLSWRLMLKASFLAHYTTQNNNFILKFQWTMLPPSSKSLELSISIGLEISTPLFPICGSKWT